MPKTGPKQHDEPVTRRSGLRLVWAIAAIVVRSVTLGLVGVCAASPELIGLDWRFDIVASLIAQACFVGLLLCIWQAVFRRWIWCALFAVVTIAAFSWMARVDRAPAAGADTAGTVVSVLAMNVHSRNERVEEVFELIDRTDADIVVIVESSWAIIRALPESAEVLERYPHRDGMDARSSGQIIVLSKHPMAHATDKNALPGLASSWGYRAGYIRLGGQIVRFGAVHAPSPRTRITWQYGQQTFTRLAQHFERLGPPMGSPEQPVIIAGDLNSPPTSLRSRKVTEELGLRRAKPLRVWSGTFPASLPWFARSSIDGLFVSPGISVRSWETVKIPGSDHRGVLSSLVVAPRSDD